MREKLRWPKKLGWGVREGPFAEWNILCRLDIIYVRMGNRSFIGIV